MDLQNSLAPFGIAVLSPQFLPTHFDKVASYHRFNAEAHTMFPSSCHLRAVRHVYRGCGHRLWLCCKIEMFSSHVWIRKNFCSQISCYMVPFVSFLYCVTTASMKRFLNKWNTWFLLDFQIFRMAGVLVCPFCEVYIITVEAWIAYD